MLKARKPGYLCCGVARSLFPQGGDGARGPQMAQVVRSKLHLLLLVELALSGRKELVPVMIESRARVGFPGPCQKQGIAVV